MTDEQLGNTPSDDLMNEARILAQKFAQGPTRAFGAAKHLLDSAFSEGLETQMDREVRNIAAMMETKDAPHGIEAFLAKFTPKFSGE
ncbi:MAG: enoyl-CoA hydratase-related protein [Pseudomonadota bacterium]